MKIRPFEIGLLVTFGILAIVSVVLLRTATPGTTQPGSEEYVGPVQIWGTLPQQTVGTVLSGLIEADENLMGVTYRYIPPESFGNVLTEALADSAGPDTILVSHEELVEQRRRVLPVPYEQWPIRDFQDTYLDGASIFARSDGIYGAPLLVDPLMLYWNKNILTNNNFLAAPRTWEELVNVQLPAMVDKSFDRSINRAVVAFGTYDNLENAYGVLSLLLIQGGSSLVSETASGASANYSLALDVSKQGGSATPFTDSLQFFLRFSQPANAFYSWNRSFESDQAQFISGDLVFYFGHASEAVELESLNPNLDFDIAEVPQGESADVRRTYGTFYALMPLRTADNLSGAFNVRGLFSAPAVTAELASLANMVPASRSLVAAGSNDIYGRVAYRSAPVAQAWLSPDRAATDEIFSDLVTDVSENRSEPQEAVDTAELKLQRLY